MVVMNDRLHLRCNMPWGRPPAPSGGAAAGKPAGVAIEYKTLGAAPRCTVQARQF